MVLCGQTAEQWEEKNGALEKALGDSVAYLRQEEEMGNLDNCYYKLEGIVDSVMQDLHVNVGRRGGEDPLRAFLDRRCTRCGSNW